MLELSDIQPIYLLVMEQDRSPLSFQMGGIPIWHIIKSIPCDIRDFDTLWKREVTPLDTGGRYVTGWLVLREPENIVRDSAEGKAM